MAAGLGYIEFATGDILTAAVANGYLASQTVMVFANSSARSTAITSPQEGMISYLKDTNAVEYYSGSAWAAVGGGGGGGKVLQVVQATYATQVNVATSTPTDTGLTASITPSATTSKVLVMAFHSGVGKDTGATSGNIDLVRNGTKINTFPALVGLTGNTSTNIIGSVSFNYLDSPSSTSAVTYKTQLLSVDNISKVFTNAGGGTSTIILMEIGA